MNQETTIEEVNNQIEKINDKIAGLDNKIKKLTGKKQKLLDYNHEKVRSNIKSEYGNFLYVIEIEHNGLFVDRGCFSDKKIAQKIIQKTEHQKGLQIGYYRNTDLYKICIREVDELSVEILDQINDENTFLGFE